MTDYMVEFLLDRTSVKFVRDMCYERKQHG